MPPIPKAIGTMLRWGHVVSAPVSDCEISAFPQPLQEESIAFRNKKGKAMWHHKTGIYRYQMSFGSLEDYIRPENPVRIIDAFVEMLDMKTFGLQHVQVKEKGAPSYHPSLLLKPVLLRLFQSNPLNSASDLVKVTADKECGPTSSCFSSYIPTRPATC
jgi:hypothetical protein